jgi:hypothetical protein
MQESRRRKGSAPKRNLLAAEAARDAAGQQLRRKHATYIGGYDDDGNIVVGCSSNPTGCAELDAKRQLGPDLHLTTAKGWRRNNETSELEWTDIPTCAGCQDQFDESQFPPDVRADPGGRWGR